MRCRILHLGQRVQHHRERASEPRRILHHTLERRPELPLSSKDPRELAKRQRAEAEEVDGLPIDVHTPVR